MGLFNRKPKALKIKGTKKEKKLLIDFEAGRFLQIDNKVDNIKHFREVDNV